MPKIKPPIDHPFVREKKIKPGNRLSDFRDRVKRDLSRDEQGAVYAKPEQRLRNAFG
jgi:hypothetical protein